LNKNTTKNPFEDDIHTILNKTNFKHIAIEKLKKLLIKNGYKVTNEEEYLIQFKDTSFFAGSPIDINLEKYRANDTIINIEIQKILNESIDRKVIVNKLKKLLLPIGYKVTIEEEYLIQFKDTSSFTGNPINIDLEIYATNIQEQESAKKDNPYEILQCKKTDDNTIIKKKYRELIMKFHPDHIQAKGLDEEFIKFAKKKLQDINKAYDMIKEARGI